MKRTLILSLLVVMVIIVAVVSIYKNQIFKTPDKGGRIIMDKKSAGKKIAIIIAFRDFQDEEYFIPKEILEKSGAGVKTVSNELEKAFGSQGGEAQVDIELTDLKVSDFDAIVFVGGSGAPQYLDNETSYQIAKDAVSQGKILAAICITPTILAQAGVLQDKKATVWSSVLDKSAVKILKENGTRYQDKNAVADGNIITANGPDAAKEFGEAIVLLLKLQRDERNK